MATAVNGEGIKAKTWGQKSSASRSPTPHHPSRRFCPPAHPRSPSPGECPFRRWGVAPVPACVPCLTNLAPRPSEAAPPAVVWAGHCHTHGQRGSIYGALPLASPSGEPFPQRTLLSSNLPAIGQARLMLHPPSTCPASRWVARTANCSSSRWRYKSFRTKILRASRRQKSAWPAT